eukprot:gene4685-5560_t
MEERYADGVEDMLREAGIKKDNVTRITRSLRARKKKLNVMLGILPEEYIEELRGTRQERWEQSAGAATALAKRAPLLLQKYRDMVREEAVKWTDEEMGWKMNNYLTTNEEMSITGSFQYYIQVKEKRRTSGYDITEYTVATSEEEVDKPILVNKWPR